MNKFGRTYRIVIDPKDGLDPIVITLPFSVQFWMQRSQMSNTNYLSVDIYNLGKATRDRIFQDRFEIRDRTISFQAGYDVISTIFDGTIYEAGSSRNGTDVITRIEARDGSFDIESTQVFETFQTGKTVGDIFDFLIGKFPTLERGAVGDYSETINRPVVLNGNAYDLLKKYSDNQVFVDKNKVFILKADEAIAGEVQALNVQTGLLETPMRNDGSISVPTLFEPRVTIGQTVDLESEILPVYNAQYKVIGITHEGMISESVGGNCRSTFDLWVGNNKFQIVKGG